MPAATTGSGTARAGGCARGRRRASRTSPSGWWRLLGLRVEDVLPRQPRCELEDMDPDDLSIPPARLQLKTTVSSAWSPRSRRAGFRRCPAPAWSTSGRTRQTFRDRRLVARPRSVVDCRLRVDAMKAVWNVQPAAEDADSELAGKEANGARDGPVVARSAAQVGAL